VPSIYQPTASTLSSTKPASASTGLSGGLLGSSFSTTTTTTVQQRTSNKKFVRKAAGEVWVDETLNEWPENDFRLFVGDLGKETTDQMLIKEFSSFKSFAKVREY
jgi:RNA recognition motif-containing protein